jgi:hypothetical protein
MKLIKHYLMVIKFIDIPIRIEIAKALSLLIRKILLKLKKLKLVV